MTASAHRQPAIVLVDDDFHSARLMTRMLASHGAPALIHLSDPETALEILHGQSLLPGGPTLVIVDLKSSSAAAAEFIARLVADVPGLQPGLQIAAMSPTLDQVARNRLLDAGADAVFQRQPDLDLYRREAAHIVSFWVRNQRLDAVGA